VEWVHRNPDLEYQHTILRKVNPETKTFYLKKTASNLEGTYEQYFADGTRYLRNQWADPPSAGAYESGFEEVVGWPNNPAGVLAAYEFASVERGTRHGMETLTYTEPSPRSGAAVGKSLTTTSGSLTTTVDGLAVEADLAFEAEKKLTDLGKRPEFTLETSSVGDVSITEPDWTSEAAGDE
jgi:hypothetical protein